MHLVYVDESGDEQYHAISALAIPVQSWRTCFNQLKAFRKSIKASDGILVRGELHAWKFVSGRGNLGDRVVFKSRRIALYHQFLEGIADLDRSSAGKIVVSHCE